ncbi:hypothetical protein GE09DRAFT_1227266 [Coniochaeta sp. 2T2.1]|nr:hypothetical protein GE09DRAFT_1227266 [Coniochaeta sp. 2T2.1]
MSPTLPLPTLPTLPLLILLLLTNHPSPIHATLTIPGNFANHLANLAAVAATTTAADPGAAACATAYAVVDSCYSASPGLSTAPESEAAACLCCVGSTVEVDGFYSSCAEYIAQSYPGSTTQYAAFTGLADACASEMPVCGAGGGGGSGSATVTSTARTTTTGRTTTGTATATRTGGGGGGSATDVPDACTSLQDIISSCVDATPSLTAAPDSVAASCVCYTTSAGTSSFTTEIDDLASSCAPWAKASAAPSAYSLILGFEDFCENFSPAAATGTRTTRTRTTSDRTTATDTDTESTTSTALGGGGTTRTTAGTGVSTTTSSASGNGAAAGMGGGGGRWSGGWGVEVVAGVLGWLLFV